MVKNRQFCQKSTLWTKKINRMSFFTIFSRKNYCLMPIYIFKKKNVRSLKTQYSHDHFVEKTSILSELRNIVLLCQLKKKTWKTPAVMPIFDQKTSILSKQHYIMSQRSQYDALFFRFITKQSSYVWKNVQSLKNTLLSSLYFVKKTSILSKALCCYVIFSKFSWKITRCKDHIGQKTSILSKIHYNMAQ